MSRTQEAQSVKSPVVERYSIDMKLGKFSMSNDDSDDFNEVKLPFHFILLDANAFRIKGKNQVRGWDIKSDLAHQKLQPVVAVTYKDKQGKEGVIASGQWKDIKNEVNDLQGRYNNVLFAAKPSGELITLTLRGKGYSKWLDFLDKNKAEGAKSNDPAVRFANHYFSIIKLEGSKSEFGDSFVPAFALNKISKQETFNMADKLDIELQLYFAELFGQMQATPTRGDFPNEEQGSDSPPAGFVESDFPAAEPEDENVWVPPATDDLPF
jgi:hypothetical protein